MLVYFGIRESNETRVFGKANPDSQTTSTIAIGNDSIVLHDPSGFDSIEDYFKSCDRSSFLRYFKDRGHALYWLLNFAIFPDSKLVELQTQSGPSKFYFTEYGGSRKEWYFVEATDLVTAMYETRLSFPEDEDLWLGPYVLLKMFDRLNEYEHGKFLPCEDLAQILTDPEITENPEFAPVKCWVTQEQIERYKSPGQREAESIKLFVQLAKEGCENRDARPLITEVLAMRGCIGELGT